MTKPSLTHESSSTVIEFPSRADSRWAKDQKEHTAKICTFIFDQVLPDPGLTPAEKLVAISIAGHINWKSGEAWPGIRTIAKRAGLKKVDTVIKAIRKFEATGSQVKVVSPGSHGSGNSAHYRLLLDEEKTLHAAERSAVTQDDPDAPRDGSERSTARKETLHGAEKTLHGMEQNNLKNNRENNLKNNLPDGRAYSAPLVDRVRDCFSGSISPIELSAALKAAHLQGWTEQQLLERADDFTFDPKAFMEDIASNRNQVTIGSS